MLKVSFALFLLAAAAFAESVRETETWMPPKVGQSSDDMGSSGDFNFPNEDGLIFDDEDEDDYEDTAEYDDMSGSGDVTSLEEEGVSTTWPEDGDNHIPDMEAPVQPQPTDNYINLVRQNEVAHPPSVQLSHAGEQNIFKKTEVLA
ncbi:syndecan-4-like, partial [Clarias magur]